MDAAAAACRDPRFMPLKNDELGSIIIEVSVLTSPKKLKTGNPEARASSIVTGKDGIIIRRGTNYGLLLPQVASEHGFDAHEFLVQACLKAGLPPTAWMEPETEIYTFEAEVFSETVPPKLEHSGT